MLIGLTGEGHDEHGSRDIIKEAILTDIAIPTEVSRSLSLARQGMGLPETKDWPPVAMMVYGGHGCDTGLIFKDNLETRKDVPGEEFGFTTGKLIARVSYGTGEPIRYGDEKDIFRVAFRDPTNLARFHISLFGERKFFPPNWEKFQGRFLGEESIARYLTERVHLSLRWQNAEPDNRWNNPVLWSEHMNSSKGGKPSFHEKRTSYFGNSSLSFNAINDSDAPRMSREDKMAERRRVVEQLIGTKKRILPDNVPFENVKRLFPNIPDEKLYSMYGVYNLNPKGQTLRHVGYAPVLDVLSRFGDVSVEDAEILPHMIMPEGIDFLFNRALPAMKAFVEA